MVDRQDLRRRAVEVKESVAGTLGEARDRAREIVTTDEEDNLGPDRGTRDQLDARVQRAQQEARQSAAQAARQEFLDDVRDDVREARKELLKAEFRQEAAPDIARLERRADQARIEAARVDGRREAFDEARDDRIQTVKAREKQRTLDRLEPEREPTRGQPAAPFGGLFGRPPAPAAQSAPAEPEPREPVPAPMGGLFGQPPAPREEREPEPVPSTTEPERLFGLPGDGRLF